MKRYDPSRTPNPAEWLELDEQERMLMVKRFHRKSGDTVGNQLLHAIVHVVVENQLAMGHAPAQRALDRLMDEGLDRHEAIHAIGSVLAGRLFEIMKGTAPGTDLQGAYDAELEQLSAAKWRAG